ncbi:CmpA/NrtA family ABC transporter substrate-binding protein [Pontivivens nitratireducens]|uniref:ABC transporter substrate-binding protein n=1 Tax=Pontivivens nitratireducens TaxID=2758038 RepID=A0A6G7VKS5_9RHOB|nr:CmpA/NrtA family ABC transporter substrate-binding protein [Pontibrevibacter nitratireducens]QIK40466.1 ABC transporter substrate-binding protein [Pontibrevibacter nitratireducens]
MRSHPVSLGFIPLIDAAPLIIAHEMGYAHEEGLDLTLSRAPSWSALRDMLRLGRVDAAHMLAPVPVAAALGLGGVEEKLSAVSVLSVNGNVIGVSRALAARLRDQGHSFGFDDAWDAGRALIAAADKPLRIGVPFPFSMHAELVYYWLKALGMPAPEGLIVRVVPPPHMGEAIRAGEIDAFCVGEPWGSHSVESGVGELLLPCSRIWAFAPEKVLAVRDAWIEQEPRVVQALIRALWRAGRWLANPSSRALATELLSRSQWLNLPAELLDRALSGTFVTSPDGTMRRTSGFVEFHRGAANFPWRSQAEWIASRLANRVGLDPDQAAEKARSTFRSDIYRAAMANTGADLPGASAKLEGALSEDTPVASRAGRLILPRDCFFNGEIFEPLLK